MSRFSIDTESELKKANLLNTIADQIAQLANETESLIDQLSIYSDAAAAIKEALKNSVTNARNDRERVISYADALTRIAALYSETDGRISGNTDAAFLGVNAVAAAAGNVLASKVEPMGISPSVSYSADPVNLSNGNFVYEKSFFDFATPVPLSFRIFYNSLSRTEGLLGIGWTHSFERRIIFRDEEARVQKEDGGEEHFIRRHGGGYLRVPGSSGMLEETADGYTYTDSSKIRYLFDKDGRLRSVADPDGWRISLSYDRNLLSGLSCPNGISVTFGYSGEDKLTSLTDHTGRKVKFAYLNDTLTSVTDTAGNTTKYLCDTAGRLTEIISPSGVLSVRNTYDDAGRTIRQEFADGGLITYRYDDAKKLVIMQRQDGSEAAYYHDELMRNTKIVFSDGEERSEYNDDNKRITFIDKLGRVSGYSYFRDGSLKSFINANGNEMSLELNAQGQISRVLLDHQEIIRTEYDDNGRQTAVTDAIGGVSRNEYDDLGRLIRVIQQDGSEVCLTYDSNGEIGEVTDPVTGKTTYVHDACHRVILKRDAAGNETRYEYDDADRLTSIWNPAGRRRSYTYDTRGNLTDITDFNDGKIHIRYNAMNRPVSVTDPDGNTTLYEYDIMSRLIRKTAADKGETVYTYDSEGRLTQIRHPMGGTEYAEYDAAGNLIRRTAQDGGVYEFSYDGVNRVVSVKDPMGGTRSFEWDALGNETAIIYEDGSRESYTYDLKGNRTSRTDQSGYTQYYRYSPLGDIQEISDDQGVLVTYDYAPGGLLLSESHVNGRVIRYSYDVLGNITQIDDNAGGRWKYRYDCLGQVIQTEHEGEGTESYEYDPSGNVTAVISPKGDRTQYHYTKAGALVLVTDAYGAQTAYQYDTCRRISGVLQPENGSIDPETINDLNEENKQIRFTRYRYDLNGNLSSVIDPDNNSISYRYDECDRVIRKKDQDGYTVVYAYRPDGLEEYCRYSDSKTVRYHYNALRRLDQLEDWLGITTIITDPAGRIESVTDHEKNRIEYAWNKLGQRVSMTYPDGRTVSYRYNNKRQLQELTSGNSIVRYDYYPDGNLRSRKFNSDAELNYQYNQQGRLAKITGNAHGKSVRSVRYVYDAAGRKQDMEYSCADGTKVLYQYQYNSLSCLTDIYVNGQREQHFEYDRFGNRTQWESSPRSVSYIYGRNNQLLKKTEGADVHEYNYDRRGNLTGEIVNGIQKLSLSFGAVNRMEHAASDRGKAKYIYNGLGMLSTIHRQMTSYAPEDHLTYLYDYADKNNMLIGMAENGTWQDFIWDRSPLQTVRSDDSRIFLCDELNSCFCTVSEEEVKGWTYDPFGNCGQGMSALPVFAFTAFRPDPVTGFYDAGWRQYDTSSGRFIGIDPMPSNIYQPLTENAYSYCNSDPVNNTDPFGLFILSGLVGAG